MGGDTSDLVILFAILATRFIVPLFIPRFPLPAILAASSSTPPTSRSCRSSPASDLDGYQSYDKALDIYYLTVAYLSVIRNWTNGYAVEVARFLWYYRLVGVLLFEITGPALAAAGVPQHVRVLLHRLRGRADCVGTRGASAGGR